MSEYVSIREEVLRKLEANLPEIQERFGIVTIGIFGSVSRGDDIPESDVDVLYKFRSGTRIYHNLLDLGDYLEELLGRKVDLIGIDWIDPLMKETILSDSILLCSAKSGKNE